MFGIHVLWNEIKLPALMLFTCLFGGALGYKVLFPEETWMTLIYATSITLSTVGYGDVLGVEGNTIASIYTIFLIFLGMGVVLYAASTITAFAIEGRMQEVFIKQSIKKRVGQMQDHYIVCGAGETGHHVIKEIYNSGKPLVVIDQSEDAFHTLLKEFPKLAVLIGDATNDDLLLEANICSAKGLIASLKNDRDNLFLTLAAKMLNSKLQVAAKSTDMNLTKKLKNAGADHVICPQFIGGMRIASVMLRPNVVSFLDRMLRGKDKSIRVGEFTIPKGSSLEGKTLGQALIFDKTGINVFAYTPSSDSDEYQYNPKPETNLKAGGVLLFICGPEQQEKLETSFS